MEAITKGTLIHKFKELETSFHDIPLTSVATLNAWHETEKLMNEFSSLLIKELLRKE